MSKVQHEINFQKYLNARVPHHEFAKQMGIPKEPYGIKGVLHK